jgi:hypothetical protein|tara:strand:- start:58547 stop:59014 length:468 start_codon:yes stop_codon:yes gene_type:complete
MSNQNSTYKVNIEVECPISEIDSTINTALEGGSNYWYNLDHNDIAKAKAWLQEKIVKGEIKRNPEVHYEFMDAIYNGYKDGIKVYDVNEMQHDEDYNEDNYLGVITMDNIMEGLKECAIQDNKNFSQHFPEYDNGDSCSADVVFQYIVLKDCIFG